jgi:hypothetical protein
MADRDIGDMFLNFELHHSAWPYVGIDLAPVLANSDSEPDLDLVRWFHWVRLLMGFRPSPYCAIKTSLVAEEVIRLVAHVCDMSCLVSLSRQMS